MERALQDIQEDPVFQALNPKQKQFIEARWLPKELNPYLEPYGIRIAALITFTVFPHIKSVAVVQMMMEDYKSGLYDKKHTLVMDSSGNAAHAVVRLARAFGMEVVVVMAADTPESKKGIIAALSPKRLIEVGKGESVAQVAREEAQKPGHHHLNQYGHMGNMRAHMLYTGPEILRVLGPDAVAVAISLGSGATAGGVGNFFKAHKLQTAVLGVRPLPGERVPGARDRERMEEVVTLPWEESVAHVFEVGRKESFIRMRRLWSAVEPQPGPTSGLAWGGLEKSLQMFPPEALKRFEGKAFGFVCPDDGRFYSERTGGELDTDQGV